MLPGNSELIEYLTSSMKFSWNNVKMIQTFLILTVISSQCERCDETTLQRLLTTCHRNTRYLCLDGVCVCVCI